MKKSILLAFYFTLALHVIHAQNVKFYNVVEEKGRFIVSNTILMEVASDNTIWGYYGWAAQGLSEYYLSGKIEGAKIIGTLTTLSDNTYSEPINWTVLPNAIKASTPMGIDHVNSSTASPISEDALLTFYEEPSFNSKLMASDYMPSGKNAQIVQVGKVEKNKDSNEGYNIWYKVKTNDIEGWVFGAMHVLF